MPHPRGTIPLSKRWLSRIAPVDDKAKSGTLNMKDGSNLASADTSVRSISEFDSTNGGS
jgi:hypothetical protein